MGIICFKIKKKYCIYSKHYFNSMYGFELN